MPPRPCLTCGALTSGSYCPAHRPASGSPPGTRAWRRLREAVLRRDGYACVRCGCRDGLEVHHRRLRAHGGRDELDNLETLCGTCHRGQHAPEPPRVTTPVD